MRAVISEENLGLSVAKQAITIDEAYVPMLILLVVATRVWAPVPSGRSAIGRYKISYAHRPAFVPSGSSLSVTAPKD
jgi:hypothetical protein